MSFESLKQAAIPGLALALVILGFGAAILLQSGVLLSILVILPFLLGIWLAQNHRLRLTRQCLAIYSQTRKPLQH